MFRLIFVIVRHAAQTLKLVQDAAGLVNPVVDLDVVLRPIHVFEIRIRSISAVPNLISRNPSR
jgi:hypothetical protein